MNTVKSYQEFINEGVKYIPSPEEAKADIEKVRDAMTKAEKQAIADKYGINSVKINDIVDGIKQILNDLHKTKSPNEYTDDDFKAWWNYFDGPTSSVSLKKALAGEKIEWCQFVLDKAKELVFAGKRGDYWTRAQRSYEKYITGLLNKDKNSKDTERLNLIATLVEKTKEFHDNYIENVKIWSKKKYDCLYQMKDFKMEDYMSIFGVIDRESMIERGKGGRNRLPIRDEAFYKYFCPKSEEYSASKSINIFGVKYDPVVIKKAAKIVTYSHRDVLTATGEEFADIPNATALKYYAEVTYFASQFKWDLNKYTDYNVDEAEKKYKRDIEAIAEKVRRMNMDEEVLELLSIESDPKHYDITLTDGKKTVHARSIFAAEFSYKVTPHYRFIIT